MYFIKIAFRLLMVGCVLAQEKGWPFGSCSKHWELVQILKSQSSAVHLDMSGILWELAAAFQGDGSDKLESSNSAYNSSSNNHKTWNSFY